MPHYKTPANSFKLCAQLLDLLEEPRFLCVSHYSYDLKPYK